MQFVLTNWYLFLGLVVVLVMFVMPILIQQRYGIKSLTPAQTVLLVNRESAVVIDVREPGEYGAGHITNAINVPLSTLGQSAALLDKHKKRPVVVICRTGQRALKGATQLRKQNFPTVHILGGGLTAWERATLPLEK